MTPATSFLSISPWLRSANSGRRPGCRRFGAGRFQQLGGPIEIALMTSPLDLVPQVVALGQTLGQRVQTGDFAQRDGQYTGSSRLRSMAGSISV